MARLPAPSAGTVRDSARTLLRIFGRTRPYCRPHLAKGILGTACSVIAGVFGVLSTMAMAFLLEVLKGGALPQAPAAPSGLGGGFLDLNTMGQQALRLFWGPLNRLENPMLVTGIVSALVLVTVTAAILFSVLSRRLWMGVRVKVGRQLQVALFEHLLRLPIHVHVRERMGSLLSRLQLDVPGVAFILPTLCDTLVRCPFMMAAFFVLLVKTNVTLTLVTLGAAGLYLVGNIILGRLTRKIVIKRSKTSADVMSLIQEALLSIRVVKAFCAEGREIDRLRAETQKLTQMDLDNLLYEKDLPEASQRILGVITLGLIGMVASNLVAHGTLTREGMLLFLGATTGMLYSAALTGKAVIDLYVMAGCASRVLELWELPSSIVDGPQEVAGFQDRLTLRHAHFTYGTKFALQDLSLTVRKGEVIGLVGPSGAGKSTLTDLMLRFYDPGEGAIELDGTDIRRFTTQSYRRLFGVVSQESLLFNDTVRNNIAYGNPQVTDDDIVRAAQVANAHDFILQLPEGYDTLVGDRGVRLSGGQRQRIAIARAIVHRPPILVFDEATSSLDNESERLVQQAMSRIIKDCTAIIVAHRLSTVQMADRLVVLDEGQIVQEGSPAELLEQEGLYRRLYEVQFADHSPAPTAP